MERFASSKLFVLVAMATRMFTRVMAPVSVMLHDRGIQILGYLDDWQVLATSRKEAMWAWDVVLRRCHQLGIVVNLAKSYFNPLEPPLIWG